MPSRECGLSKRIIRCSTIPLPQESRLLSQISFAIADCHPSTLTSLVSLVSAKPNRQHTTMNNPPWEGRTSPSAAYPGPLSSNEDLDSLTDFNPFTNPAAFGEVPATSSFGLGEPFTTTNQAEGPTRFGYETPFEATNQTLLYDASSSLRQSPFGISAPAPTPNFNLPTYDPVFDDIDWSPLGAEMTATLSERQLTGYGATDIPATSTSTGNLDSTSPQMVQEGSGQAE